MPSKIYPNWDFLVWKQTMWQPWANGPGLLETGNGSPVFGICFGSEVILTQAVKHYRATNIKFELERREKTLVVNKRGKRLRVQELR
jgi:hypothetical protein